MRDKLKNTNNQSLNSKVDQSPAKKPELSLKKKEKPAWAKTAQQAQESEEKQVDELLDFFNQEQKTDLKDFISDEEVKKILIDLKSKVEKLKEQEDWRKEQLQRIEQQRQNVCEEKEKDDILSRISRQSGAQSISSQKTAERVQEL